MRNVSPISVYVKSAQMDTIPVRIPPAHEVELFYYEDFSQAIAERESLSDLWELREHCTIFISFGLCWGTSTVQVEKVDALPCWLKVSSLRDEVRSNIFFSWTFNTAGEN